MNFPAGLDQVHGDVAADGRGLIPPPRLGECGRGAGRHRRAQGGSRPRERQAAAGGVAAAGEAGLRLAARRRGTAHAAHARHARKDGRPARRRRALAVRRPLPSDQAQAARQREASRYPARQAAPRGRAGGGGRQWTGRPVRGARDWQQEADDAVAGAATRVSLTSGTCIFTPHKRLRTSNPLTCICTSTPRTFYILYACTSSTFHP